MKESGSFSGFYKKSINERIEALRKGIDLAEEDVQRLKDGLPVELANIMVENVVATFQIPLGIATNFRVNGKDYLVPMATE